MVGIKKIAILVVIIFLIYVWNIYLNKNEKHFFNKQVVDNSFNKIINLKQEQYNLGMHSPYVFQFELTQENKGIIDKIIKRHHLKRETRIPYIIKNTPFIIDKLDIDLYKLMKKYPFYIILYEAKHEAGERVLIVTDHKIVFHTTGFVDKDRLEKVGYWYDDKNKLQGLVDKSMLYGVHGVD